MTAKTLIIGLDGQGPELIENYIASGATPNLAALMKAHTRLTVNNSPGFGDGVYWSSAATGLGPGGHGSYYILQFDPKSYELYWYDERLHFKSPAFWMMLDEEGFETFTVDWPRAPVQPLKNGRLIDCWMQHDSPRDACSVPPELIGDVERKYGKDPYHPGFYVHPIETAEKARWLIDMAVVRIEAKKQLCLDQLAEKDWDCFSVVFSEIHDMAHNAEHLVNQGHYRHDAALAQEIGNPYREICEATDKAIGEIVSAAGEDCEIILMAGLGMTQLVSANTALKEIAERLDLGLPQARPPVEQARTAYRSRVPYSIRKVLSPIKRMLLSQPKNTENVHRRFFPVEHVHHAGCIRVNLKGREKNGIIAPGEDYDRLLDQLEKDFRDIRDVETGESIVDSFVRVREVYDGQELDALPDLIVVWNRERQFNKIASPKIGEIEVDVDTIRTGDHIMVGDLWAMPERVAAAGVDDTIVTQDACKIFLSSARRCGVTAKKEPALAK